MLRRRWPARRATAALPQGWCKIRRRSGAGLKVTQDAWDASNEPHRAGRSGSRFTRARQNFFAKALYAFQHLFRGGSKRHPDTHDKPVHAAHYRVPAIERFQPVVFGTDNRVSPAPNLLQREIALGGEVLGRREHPVTKIELALLEPETAEGLLGLLAARGQP